MIAGSTFVNIFGLVPAGDPERLTKIAVAAVKAGYAVVVDRPGQKIPMCTLTARQVHQADKAAQQAAADAGDPHAGRRRHPCGLHHALTDAVAASRVLGRMVTQAGHVNLGLELGASRLVVVDVDTAEQHAAFLADWSQASGTDQGGRNPTVRSPGARNLAGDWVHKDGGHYWFALPGDTVLPAHPGVLTAGGGWAVMWAGRQVLIPPSVRPEGAYELLGTSEDAPFWLLDRIRRGAAEHSQRVDAGRMSGGSEAIDTWADKGFWGRRLPADEWTPHAICQCGCPTWTAPGEHASPKSATAHEVGCTQYRTENGWGPLHLWTDHPPDELAEWVRRTGSSTLTPLQYVAAVDHGGDVGAAMTAEGITSDVGDGIIDPEAALRPPGTPLGAQEEQVATQIPVATLGITWASTIRSSPVHWGWADRMPIGEITLIPGREGAGKSLLLAWLAGQLTMGTLPGEFHGRARAVLYVASEDSWRYTVRPRLEAAGADLSLVGRIDVPEGGRLSLPGDCARLVELAASVDAAALMLDPIISLIDDRLSVDKARELRRALEPLRAAAESASMMVPALAHFNKMTDADVMTKIPGSRAWAEVARAAIGVAEDEEQGGYVVSQIKNNLGRLDLPNLSYRIEGVAIPTPDGPADVGRLVWTGESETNVAEVLSRRPERRARDTSEVTKMLTEYVEERGAPVLLTEIYQEFPEIKRETIRQALLRQVRRGTLSNPVTGQYELRSVTG